MHRLNWMIGFYIDNLKAVSQTEQEKKVRCWGNNPPGNPRVLRVRAAGCIVLTQE